MGRWLPRTERHVPRRRQRRQVGHSLPATGRDWGVFRPSGRRSRPSLTGEIGYSITAYQGFIIVGTRFGFRMMVAGSDGLLTSGAGVPTGSPVYDFEGQNSFVWFTNSPTLRLVTSL